MPDERFPIRRLRPLAVTREDQQLLRNRMVSGGKRKLFGDEGVRLPDVRRHFLPAAAARTGRDRDTPLTAPGGGQAVGNGKTGEHIRTRTGQESTQRAGNAFHRESAEVGKPEGGSVRRALVAGDQASAGTLTDGRDLPSPELESNLPMKRRHSIFLTIVALLLVVPLILTMGVQGPLDLSKD